MNRTGTLAESIVVTRFRGNPVNLKLKKGLRLVELEAGQGGSVWVLDEFPADVFTDGIVLHDAEHYGVAIHRDFVAHA